MTIFIVVATALVIALLLLFRRRGDSPTKSASVDEIPGAPNLSRRTRRAFAAG